MSASTLRIIARLKARPGKEKDLRGVLEVLVAPTLKESGCISYQMWANKEDPGEFTFVEEWANDAALDAHFATPHIKAALARFPELLAQELDLRKYTVVK